MRKILAARLLTLGIVSLLLTVTASAEPTPNAHGGPSTAHPYEGKTLTFIVPGGPISSLGLWARYIAPLMASYLHANVRVLDDASGAPYGGQSDLAGSNPNGLTFGEIDLPDDLSTLILHQLALPVDLNKLQLVAVSGPETNLVWSAVPSSGFRTFKSFAVSSSASMLDGSTGLSDVIIRAVNGIFGIKSRIITGYVSSEQLVYGFERGDAPIAAAPVSDFLNLIGARLARPLLLLSAVEGLPAAQESGFKGVPTLEQFAKQDPPRTEDERAGLAELLNIADSFSGYAIAVPTGTSAVDRAALLAAYKESAGEVVLSGKALQVAYEQTVKNVKLLSQYMPNQ